MLGVSIVDKIESGDIRKITYAAHWIDGLRKVADGRWMQVMNKDNQDLLCQESNTGLLRSEGLAYKTQTTTPQREIKKLYELK